MAILLGVYLVYVVLYFLVSYAVVYHLIRYRMKGDKSNIVLYGYISLSATLILGSLLLLRPIEG